MIGQLIKITAAKKLMIKIDKETFEQLLARQVVVLRQNKMPVNRVAVFQLDNEDGSQSLFVTLSLDKYDKQLLSKKFEPLIKKNISFQCRTKVYDFLPDGETEQIRGVNLELVSIRLVPLILKRNYSAPSDSSDSDEDSEEEELKMMTAIKAEEEEIPIDVLLTTPPKLIRKKTQSERRRRTPESEQ